MVHLLPPKRPRSLEEYVAATKKTITPEGWQAALAFQPRPSDVVISPFAKSGTTWLQQIAHGLRTRGSMDFAEINDVVPWIEQAHDYGWDLAADQVAFPRVYKSHMTWHDVPKGGRYIVAVRNPFAVIISYYRFLEGWLFERNTVTLDEWARFRFTTNPETSGYWYHLLSWWEQRHNPDVLLLCFENMQADLTGTVRAVARFMEIDLDDELFEVVVRQSSKDFMLQHKNQFDEHLIQAHWERCGVAPVDPNTAKVTPGPALHERYTLSPALKADLDAIWDRLFYQRFGLNDYEALRAALAEAQI